MRNLNLIIYFCILGFQPLFGQFAPSEIDSLTENVNIENSPCEKALKLNILARNYCFLDLHKARESVNQGLELSRKNNCLASKALLFNTMSIICDMQGNYSHAYIYSDSALAINYLLGDKHAAASALDNKGIFYTHQGDYTSALKMQLKSLQLFEDLKDTAAIAINLNNLFGVYYLSKDYENALRTGKKAILYFEKSRNLDGLGRMNVNLSMVHRDNQNLDSALFYAIKGLDYFNHLQSREGVADASVNLAEVYLSSGNFNEAEKLITFAAVEYEEMGAYSKKLDIKGSLIKIFEAEGKYFEALNIALEMLNLANTSDQLQYRRDA
ncbi:MAG: tetratricopeptide repeat protein, partial [Bacteroidetes bacterium]|nr:tetratricopeptide repeat protein [Bacteroidota bacterium]